MVVMRSDLKIDEIKTENLLAVWKKGNEKKGKGNGGLYPFPNVLFQK